MKKRLRGAAHGFAQHCVSGLSFIQPHLSEELFRLGKDNLKVVFLPELDFDPAIKPDRPLFLALSTARNRLIEILGKHSIKEDEITEACAVFSVREGRSYESSIEFRILAEDGSEVTRRL